MPLCGVPGDWREPNAAPERPFEGPASRAEHGLAPKGRGCTQRDESSIERRVMYINPWLMVSVAFASGLALATHRWTLAAIFAAATAALLANGLFLNGDARPPGGGDWSVGAIYLLAGAIALVAFTLGVGIGLIGRRLKQ